MNHHVKKNGVPSHTILRDRGQMLSSVRSFFQKRDILEVDCPLLSHYAPIDPHIDLFEVSLGEGKKGYLHSSPEYGMKRLLSENIGPIYQLSHVYRKEEVGKKHTPEFTLIEWYRPGFSFDTFLTEVIDLIALFLGNLPFQILTYQKAFELYAKIDCRHSNITTLRKKAKECGFYSETEERETVLNLLWGVLVEPHLGKEMISVITHYPPDQAALARTHFVNGEEFAERFELYFNQMELGNGYHELTDLKEQERRLNTSNQKRIALGKKPLPIDPHFLQALERGLPDSYGIAIGFDRLMMLRHHVDKIESILPFSWDKS